MGVFGQSSLDARIEIGERRAVQQPSDFCMHMACTNAAGLGCLRVPFGSLISFSKPSLYPKNAMWPTFRYRSFFESDTPPIERLIRFGSVELAYTDATDVQEDRPHMAGSLQHDVRTPGW